MGPLVILLSKNEIDLEHVFRYPLTSVPLSLCCSDGMMGKQKMHPFLTIREEVATVITRTVDASGIDGQFVLHTLPTNIPGIYGGLAQTYRYCI